jgi:hypothetical protein
MQQLLAKLLGTFTDGLTVYIKYFHVMAYKENYFNYLLLLKVQGRFLHWFRK